MTRYESKSLRPVGLNDVCHLPVANHRILKKYQFLTPGPCPHEISIKMNITLVELTFYLKINLWVQPLRNYSKGRKKSQLKTYSATFLRDVQANLLGVNKKLPHVLVVIPCSQGARPCWQTWRWRLGGTMGQGGKAQQKWRYNQFNQPK